MLTLLKPPSRPKLKVVREGHTQSENFADSNEEKFQTRRKGLFGFLEALVRSENPPWFDARGAAIGLMIGLGVPIGGQMIVLALLRLCFRFNALIAFAMTWINNPLSLLPLYYGYYYVGSLILDRPVAMSVEDFQALFRPILHAGYFWGSVHAFLLMSWDILKRWTVCAVIFSLVSGLLGYVVAHRIQKKRSSVEPVRWECPTGGLLNSSKTELISVRIPKTDHSPHFLCSKRSFLADGLASGAKQPRASRKHKMPSEVRNCWTPRMTRH